MTTLNYTNSSVMARASNKGAWFKLSIYQDWYCDNPRNKDDEIWSKELLTFGDCFQDTAEIETFKKSKLFKAVLAGCVKNKPR